MKYQLISLHNHKTHISEHSIQKFKGNFMAGLASLDLDFIKREWDILVE